MMFDFVSLGDLVADLVVGVPRLPICAGEHQRAHLIEVEAGGNCNSLIMAARLGLRAKAVGVVGADFYGAEVIRRLQNEQVDVTHVRQWPGGETGIAIVLVDDAAQHVFVGKHGAGPVYGAPQAPSADWQTIIPQSRAIFTSAYDLRPTALFPGDAILDGLALAQTRQIPIFFDLGPPAFHLNPTYIQAAVEQTTVFLATAEEATAWAGVNEPLTAAQAILRLGPSLVALKLGAAGCLLVTRAQTVHVPGFTVPVRDTCGAGDAFDAACVYGWLQGDSLEQMGLLANAVGAMTVTKLGTGTRLPQRAEIAQLLRQQARTKVAGS